MGRAIHAHLWESWYFHPCHTHRQTQELACQDCCCQQLNLPFCWRHLASGLRTVLLQQRGDTCSAFALLPGCLDEEWQGFSVQYVQRYGPDPPKEPPWCINKEKQKSPVEHNPNCCQTKPEFNLHGCLRVYLYYNRQEYFQQVVSFHWCSQNYVQQDTRGSPMPPQVCPCPDHHWNIAIHLSESRSGHKVTIQC